MNELIDVARKATCQRSKCGSIVVKDEVIIGEGFNSPPQDLESSRRCAVKKSEYHQKVTDKTCCVHAEQRAIMDALAKNPDKIEGSRLYFLRLKDDAPSFAGKPYCTICSKMALDVGIAEFVLLRENGMNVYKAEEYNTVSFDYND